MRHLTLHAPTLRAALLLLAAAFLAAVAACSERSSPDAPKTGPAAQPSVPYRAVATVGMVGDIVRRVAGDRAKVWVLMGSGVDPHLYKPTRADVSAMLEADIVFYNGLMLEGKMTDALVRVAATRPVHAVTELLEETDRLRPKEDASGHYDPHVWMDPVRWGRTVDVVRDRLSAFDPAGAAAYSANAERLSGEIRSLHEYAAGVLATVPERSRVLVTAHDAFNYLASRYGFEVLGIQGLSTESEAGVQDIERIVRVLVERAIPAVFVETTVADRNVRALIAGAKAKGQDVIIGGSLFSDAMGAPGTYEGTYIGMIDHNVTTIARALGGRAPERGMSGRLATPESTAPSGSARPASTDRPSAEGAR
ncbi:MAG: zinc ABC transporter substrate-binding protein [Phycisphaerales bacterium]|nr:zinc ABC transporter substrate-binding protein [Phycisphaerales bacterium]